MAQPLYRRIRETLRQEIKQGKWAVGECIPSELELSERFQVSRFTVRQAILELVREGLLHRRSGKGTFVQATTPTQEVRRLQKGKKLLGLVLPYTTDAHTAGILKGAEREAAENGYRLIFVNSQDMKEEWSLLDELYHEGVEGVLYYFKYVDRASENVLRLRERNLPFVLVDHFIPDLPTDYVVSDNFTGAYIAIKHLLDLGHQRIALIACDWGMNSVDQREKGYRMALQSSGLEVDSSLLFLRREREISDAELAEILRQAEMTAVFAPDLIAARLIRLAYQLGIKVPEQLAMVGFDDAPISNFIIPPLTTVRQQTEEMGARAVRILTQKLAGATADLQQVVLDVELVIRDSSGVKSGLEKVGKDKRVAVK